jgi:hypothetical protein
MPIQEPVTSYSVAELRNDVVKYRQVVRLTTETGHQAFIAFPEVPPDDWLTFSGETSNVYLEEGEFDRVHHLLQSENPVFYTALNLLGIRAFNLSTTAELPGEGPADDDALTQLAAQLRAQLADTPAT